MISILRMCSLLKRSPSDTLGIGSAYFALEWVSRPEDFRPTFLNCLHLPSVKAVSIIDISDFPLTALNSSKSVKKPIWPPGSGFIPEHLTIQRCSREPVQTIIAWVEPCNLNSLEVMFHESHDTEQLSRFFSSCSLTKTFTNLSLDIKREVKSPSLS